MKRGMYTAAGKATLNAFEVAALRILSGGIVLLPVAFMQFRKITGNKRIFVCVSALLGSFIPAFLFCIAETRIDSSLAGFLNSLTPVFTIVIGLLFFKSNVPRNKITGVVIAFSGMLILFLSNKDLNFNYLAYSGFVLLATISYAFNVNIVSRFLKDVSSVNIAAVGFAAMIIPSLLVLVISGYFRLPLQQADYLNSTMASLVLGIMGTAVATILFYILLKRAGALFSSMVTYGIPFVALLWGILDGERVGIGQVIGLSIVLAGVYLANRPAQKKAETV
jgi:drug/metabolite transporter (DMT)-like permease